VTFADVGYTRLLPGRLGFEPKIVKPARVRHVRVPVRSERIAAGSSTASTGDDRGAVDRNRPQTAVHRQPMLPYDARCLR
jgi:hypothetical protein